jgi:hypothetical protein
MIFIHSTNGGTLESTWNSYNDNADGSGTSAQFIVGPDGTIWQTVEMYSSMAEYAKANDPYNNRSIAIALVHNSMEFSGKEEVPSAQYNATLQLVQYLMKQYQIPLGEHEADWVSERCLSSDSAMTPGVYGHYQIGDCAGVDQDPGQEMFTAFRADLRTSSQNPNTGGTGSGGRMVPYDTYARPYSWPTTGRILQPYGFTEEAQSLGQRFPGIYPIGDPGVIFSTTNHTEPPLDPAIAKYINPNIDIAPADDTASARAVYATQAGWLTFAGWAGPEKGYTIQLESDIEGDGQADLATRYMRLQPPEDGFFAPDIPEYYPDVAPIENPTEQNPRSLEDTVPPVYTIEAEHMKIADTTRAEATTDSLASAGAAMRLTDSTSISQSVERKADQIMISAKVTKCFIPLPEGVKMSLYVDGNLVSSANVASNIWQTYTFEPDALDGSKHDIKITYDKPLLSCSQLWIDTVNFVVVNPNTPTVERVSEVAIEAESLNPLTDEGKAPTIKESADTSDGKYVAFTSNGRLEGEINSPDSNYFSIRARADLCGEEVPVLTISLNDKKLLDLGVNQSSWMEYSTDIPSAGTADSAPTDGEATSATHKLAIEFANDEFQLGRCDRNVYVDVLSFINYQTTQTTYSETSLIGKTKYVAFNQLLGYVSSSRGTDAEWAAASTSLRLDKDIQAGELERLKQAFAGGVPNSNQTYLSYRIMYNNPNMSTFPPPTEVDRFINAKVDNPYIVETDDNTVAGNLKTIFDEPQSPMFFFCAIRQRGDNVKCIYEPNPY